jgi:hypothetical protein
MAEVVVGMVKQGGVWLPIEDAATLHHLKLMTLGFALQKI